MGGAQSYRLGAAKRQKREKNIDEEHISLENNGICNWFSSVCCEVLYSSLVDAT